jgi:hypothetical protein
MPQDLRVAGEDARLSMIAIALQHRALIIQILLAGGGFRAHALLGKNFTGRKSFGDCEGTFQR